jgi:protein SCO1/2
MIADRRPSIIVRAAVQLGIACFVMLAFEAVAADPDAAFDRERALALSQAAQGKVVSGVMLTGSDGRRFDLSDLRGKPLVLSLIFTSCHHVCPTTTQSLKRAVGTARDALGNDSFRVLTIGFDWRRDTPSMMSRFGAQQGVEFDNWDFVSADRAGVDVITRQLGFVYYPAGGGFDHLIQTSILDRDGRVYRQVYGMRFPIPHLVEPLKELVFETGVRQPLFADLVNRVRLFCTVYDPASDTYRFRYDIFVGLAIGLTLGALAIVAVVREWRHASTGSSRA